MRIGAEADGSKGFIFDAPLVVDHFGSLSEPRLVALGEMIDSACLVFPLRCVVFNDDDGHFSFLSTDGKKPIKKEEFSYNIMSSGLHFWRLWNWSCPRPLRLLLGLVGYSQIIPSTTRANSL
ncbi:hypothetical protein D3C81_1366380 [compost metagenome]